MKNIGLIGCGNIAETYFRAQDYFNNINFIACADINIEAAKKCAIENKIKNINSGEKTEYASSKGLYGADGSCLETCLNVHLHENMNPEEASAGITKAGKCAEKYCVQNSVTNTCLENNSKNYCTSINTDSKPHGYYLSPDVNYDNMKILEQNDFKKSCNFDNIRTKRKKGVKRDNNDKSTSNSKTKAAFERGSKQRDRKQRMNPSLVNAPRKDISKIKENQNKISLNLLKALQKQWR